MKGGGTLLNSLFLKNGSSREKPGLLSNLQTAVESLCTVDVTVGLSCSLLGVKTKSGRVSGSEIKTEGFPFAVGRLPVFTICCQIINHHSGRQAFYWPVMLFPLVNLRSVCHLHLCWLLTGVLCITVEAYVIIMPPASLAGRVSLPCQHSKAKYKCFLSFLMNVLDHYFNRMQGGARCSPARVEKVTWRRFKDRRSTVGRRFLTGL